MNGKWETGCYHRNNELNGQGRADYPFALVWKGGEAERTNMIPLLHVFRVSWGQSTAC